MMKWLKLIQQLQQQNYHARKFPPPNRPNLQQNRVRHKRAGVSKYCWYHGAWAHTSRDFARKRQGHTDDAKFANKTSGITNYYKSEAVTPDPVSARQGGIDEESDKLNEIRIKIKSKRKNDDLFIGNPNPYCNCKIRQWSIKPLLSIARFMGFWEVRKLLWWTISTTNRYINTQRNNEITDTTRRCS